MADVLSTNPSAQSTYVPIGFEDVTLGADFTFVNKNVRAIFVGTAGNVIASIDGTTFHTFKGCAAGTYLLGAFTKVKSTANGTTAADLVGCI